jgi:hypothetical protein
LDEEAAFVVVIGVQPHIIEAALNHVSGHKAGVAGIYNRARYEGEMRDAYSVGRITLIRSRTLMIDAH